MLKINPYRSFWALEIEICTIFRFWGHSLEGFPLSKFRHLGRFRELLMRSLKFVLIVYRNSYAKLVKNRFKMAIFLKEILKENGHFGPYFSPTSRRNFSILLRQILKLMPRALNFVLIVCQNSYVKFVKNKGTFSHFP